jgi:hypothetical protein
MIRNSMRSTRLLSWRYLRWAIAIPTLPLVWWACTSHPLEQPTPEPEMQTDVYISVAPIRQLDLVFMVDNSPSMAPKVTKMNTNFPKLIAALKDPGDGTLPDLRVAVIDSDLGTGCGYGYDPGTSCGAKPVTNSCLGDMGQFQMLTSPTACAFTAGATYLNVTNNTAVNFTGPADNINTVFACLASNMGTAGCGEEHQLQAFEFALAVSNINVAQHDFLRPSAYLGLVFLSDEDDCSAAPNDGMFGDYAALRGDSASLRCATRGHVCSGRNLTTSPPGYPATAPWETAFTDCQARTDTCPNTTDGYATGTDTSVPTDCSPLKNVQHLALEMKALKTDPENQILVAGIFGWPLSDADMASARYKIALVPNPNTQDAQHPTVYDYWPVCYDPNHKPSAATTDSATGFDATAAGWGATGGLRESAFIDEFGINGLKFSICQPDFSASMKVIGDTISKHLQNLCVDYKLVDSDLKTAGLQPDCRVVWRIPRVEKDSNKIVYDESSTSMPECLSSYSTSNRPPDCDPGAAAGAPNNPNTNPKTRTCGDCWQLTIGTADAKSKCPIMEQLITVLRTASENATPITPGAKIGMQCRTCTDMTAEICAADQNSTSCLACNY